MRSPNIGLIAIEFEKALAVSLCELESLPFEFLKIVVTTFGWERARIQLWQRPFGHFNDDVEFSADYLVDRLRGWSAYLKLLEECSTTSDQDSQRLAQVARVLTGPYKPRHFWFIYYSLPDLRKRIQDRVERLRRFAPEATDHHLDKRTVQFFTRTNRSRFSPHKLPLWFRILMLPLLAACVMLFWFLGLRCFNQLGVSGPYGSAQRLWRGFLFHAILETVD